MEPGEQRRRPKPWPDADQDFRTHDDAASWLLFVVLVPLIVGAVAVSLGWVF